MRQTKSIGVNLDATDLDAKVDALNEKLGKVCGFLRISRSVLIRIALEQLYASGKLEAADVAVKLGLEAA